MLNYYVLYITQHDHREGCVVVSAVVEMKTAVAVARAARPSPALKEAPMSLTDPGTANIICPHKALDLHGRRATQQMHLTDRSV